MARYTGPSWKQSRRLKFSVLENGKELQKRNYAPGQHGQRRAKLSEYGLQLQEKQKVRFTYGVNEKQFRNTFNRAQKMEGKHGENFLILLESRLDNLVYRMGFASTRRQARQLVNHGHIVVDGKKVDIPSYTVKPGQVIAMKETSKNLAIVKESLENTQNSKLVKVNFRNKDNCGWKMPDSVYYFENSAKVRKLSFNLDYYVSSFIEGITMNEKCYNCKFKGNNNMGDLIIGDFWKIPDNIFKSKTKNGVSAIIVKNDKGKELLNSLQNIEIKSVDIDLIINGNPNLENSIPRPKCRDDFFENLDQLNVNENFKQCNKKLNSSKKKVLKLLFDTKLLKFLKK